MKKEKFEALKEERRRSVMNSIAIAGLDNDAPVIPEVMELAEQYINFEITLEEFCEQTKRTAVKKILGIDYES